MSDTDPISSQDNNDIDSSCDEGNAIKNIIRAMVELPGTSELFDSNKKLLQSLGIEKPKEKTTSNEEALLTVLQEKK